MGTDHMLPGGVFHNYLAGGVAGLSAGLVSLAVVVVVGFVSSFIDFLSLCQCFL
jgi:hypothetical protein